MINTIANKPAFGVIPGLIMVKGGDGNEPFKLSKDFKKDGGHLIFSNNGCTVIARDKHALDTVASLQNGVFKSYGCYEKNIKNNVETVIDLDA